MTRNTKYLILNTSQRGTTLIEVLIYITLFGFIMAASLVSVYQILDYSRTASAKTSVEQEAAFIVGKIIWTLNDMDSINFPGANSSGVSLTVTKGGVPTTIALSGDDITIDGTQLNSDRIAFSALTFQRIQQIGATTVDSIKISFNANGKYFEFYRFIR